MENNIKKVYIVWYDNGLSHEEYRLDLEKVFTKEEDAKKFVEEGNVTKEFKPSYTREEYHAHDSDDIHVAYEDFVQYEYHMWSYYCSLGKYFYGEQAVDE